MISQNIFLITLMVLWGLGTTLFANLLSLPKDKLESVTGEKMIDFFIASGFLGLNIINFFNILASKIVS